MKLMTAFVAGILLFGPAITNGEVLVNEGFEPGGSAAPAFKTGASGAATVERSEEMAKDGRSSLKFVDSPDSQEKAWEPSAAFLNFDAIQPENRFKLSFDYYQLSGDGPLFSVELGNKEGRRLLRLVFKWKKLFAQAASDKEGERVATEIEPGDWHHIVLEGAASRREGDFKVTMDGQSTDSAPYWEAHEGDPALPLDYLRFFDDGNDDDVVFIDNVVLERFDK